MFHIFEVGKCYFSDLNNNFKSIIRGETNYAADGGASDAYAITLDPAPTAYQAGMVANFKANTANTGPASLNINGLGAKAIKKNRDQDLNDADIEVGQIVTVVYDGTYFQMQSQIANSKVFGAWESKSINTVYQAERDGFVVYSWRGDMNNGVNSAAVYSDSSSSPTTMRSVSLGQAGAANFGSVFSPVRRGDYYKVDVSYYGLAGSWPVYFLGA